MGGWQAWAAALAIGTALTGAPAPGRAAAPAPNLAYTAAQTDCVFDAVERSYPGLLLPAAAPSGFAAPYSYRYYAQSNAYLGVSSADHHLYYLGPASGNALYDAGPVADWLAKAGCAQTKQPIAGLVDMQGIAWHNADGGRPAFTIAHAQKFPGVYGGVVINAAWNLIQPTATGAPDFSSIDDALALVRAYNAANPAAPLGVKLRVYAGNSAPDWVKALDGGPVTITRNPAGCRADPCPITVGKYWSPTFIAAWRALQALLAARYDADPLLRHVAVTSCAPQTDEPFVPTSSTASRATLKTAGYTDALQRSCLLGAVDDYAAWTRTAVDFPVNVFTRVDGGVDAAFSLDVMERCRSRLGARCVLANHALAAPLRDADAAIYERLRTLGGPIHFQTQSPQAMGCQWVATIAQGIALGATGIEVWPDAQFTGVDSLTLADAQRLADLFVHPIAVPVNLAPQPTPCSGLH